MQCNTNTILVEWYYPRIQKHNATLPQKTFLAQAYKGLRFLKVGGTPLLSVRLKNWSASLRNESPGVVKVLLGVVESEEW